MMHLIRPNFPPPCSISPPPLLSVFQSTQKHRGFAFVTFLEKEDAAAAMDNMHCAELYGRVLSVNIAAGRDGVGGTARWVRGEAGAR